MDQIKQRAERIDCPIAFRKAFERIQNDPNVEAFIHLAPTTFYLKGSPLVVRRPTVIVGEGPYETLLCDGGFRGESLFELEADLKLVGLGFVRWRHNIIRATHRFAGVDNLDIDHCRFEKIRVTPIYMDGVSIGYFTARNSLFRRCYGALHLTAAGDGEMILEDNTMEDLDIPPVIIDRGRHCQIRGNRISGAGTKWDPLLQWDLFREARVS